MEGYWNTASLCSLGKWPCCEAVVPNLWSDPPEGSQENHEGPRGETQEDTTEQNLFVFRTFLYFLWLFFSCEVVEGKIPLWLKRSQPTNTAICAHMLYYKGWKHLVLGTLQLSSVFRTHCHRKKTYAWKTEIENIEVLFPGLISRHGFAPKR